jgi:hypothetical protein
LVGITTVVDVIQNQGRISGNTTSDAEGQVNLDFIIRHDELPDSVSAVTMFATIPGTAWSNSASITLSPEDSGEPSFVIVAFPRVIRADNGQSTVTLTAILKDPDGEGIPNKSVSFGSAIGYATSPVITDDRGVAVTIFSDDGRPSLDENGSPDSLVITARVRSLNLESSANIMIHPYNPVREIILVLQQNQAIAGDADSTQFTLTCNGIDGLPIMEPNTVHLSAGRGRVFPSLVGTENGEAISNYYPPILAGIDTITAWVDNGNGDVTYGTTVISVIAGNPVTSTWSIDPGVLYIGDPNARSNIEIQLLDQFDNPVGAEFRLNFDATLGSITETANTDQNGIASVVLRPGARSGASLITAILEGEEQNIGVTTVTFLDSPPFAIVIDAATLRLHAAGAGDTTNTAIYATVLNEFGIAVTTPTGVTFQIVDEPEPPLGCSFEGGGQTTLRETDEGVASIIFESGTEIGQKLIRAYTWADLQHQDTVSVILDGMEVVPGVPFSIELSYDRVGANAGGGEWTVEVTAEVKDVLRNPVADGTMVFFDIDGDIGNISNRTTVDGIATTPLRYRGSNTFEPITITGTVRNGDEEIFDNISFQLPLQNGAIEVNVVPGNWMFREDRELAQIQIRVELTDGTGAFINNGLIEISTPLGDLFWRDRANGEFVRFNGGRAQMLTGINDDNHDEEAGQVTVYLIAEEIDMFDDPEVSEVIVTVSVALDDYEDEVNAEVNISFTRQVEE